MCHKHPHLEVQGNQLFLIDHPEAFQSIPFFPQHFARDDWGVNAGLDSPYSYGNGAETSMAPAADAAGLPR